MEEFFDVALQTTRGYFDPRNQDWECFLPRRVTSRWALTSGLAACRTTRIAIRFLMHATRRDLTTVPIVSIVVAMHFVGKLIRRATVPRSTNGTMKVSWGEPCSFTFDSSHNRCSALFSKAHLSGRQANKCCTS